MSEENKNTISAPRSVAMPALTDAVMARLLRPYSSNHVVIYDNENNKLGREEYYGRKIYWDNEAARDAVAAKKYFDLKLPNLKVVRTLSMQVADSFFCMGTWTISGKILTPTWDGMTTVCNYVVLNEETGLYELLRADSWLSATKSSRALFASQFGAGDVAFCGAHDKKFRAAVLTARQAHTL